MRPAGRGALESLYFSYPKFSAPQDRASLTRPLSVAIVGAGPVGLTAALTLARYGVRSTVFEAKDTFNDGSRAICIARPSMQIFRTLDVVAPFEEAALPYVAGRSFYKGEQFLRFEMPDSADERYRPMYNLQQQYIEAFLHEAAANHPLIEFRWASQVERVDDVASGVELSVRDTKASYRVTASWLLAADGARSTVRAARGLRLQGDNYEGRYVIADIRMTFAHPTERLALFDPDSRPGGTVLVHRQPQNIWRIDYQLREDETEEDAMLETSIRSSVAAVLRDIGYTGDWELEWWSVYSANTLALEHYRDGRVFFVGDSAHIVPIFGVRGLNNGLADAQNIGWKLAWVLNGDANERLLASYSPERRGATLDVFQNASKSTRFMTPPTRGWKVMRDAALSLALRHSFAADFANPRNMTPYTYAAGELTYADGDEFASGPAPGAVAENVRDGERFLLDKFGAAFTVLVFGDIEGLDALAAFRPVVRVVAELPNSAIAKAYDATLGTVYLFRPDQYLVRRWRVATGLDVAACLEALCEQGCVQ